MCAKQYFGKLTRYLIVTCQISDDLEGFADFLHDYDPDHRDGEYLMRQIAIFCQIHFTRGVDDALRRTSGGQPGIRQRMLSLLFADDRKAYNAVIDFIEGKSLDIL
jgi:hypothetical protein